MEPGEEREVGEESADGIEQGIPRSGGAAGDERLVDLVEAGVASGDDEGSKAPGPVPTFAGSADAAEKQDTEDEIFGEVGALANEVVDVGDSMMAEMREQPSQERLDDAAGVFGGKEIGGHEEDPARPEQCRPPGAQPARDQRRGEARLNFGECGGGAWVAPGLVGHCGWAPVCCAREMGSRAIFILAR